MTTTTTTITDHVDQIARDDAKRALLLIAAHELLCEEREKTAALWRLMLGGKIDGVVSGVNGLYNRIWLAAGGIIVTLIACVGYLVEHHGL